MQQYNYGSFPDKREASSGEGFFEKIIQTKVIERKVYMLKLDDRREALSSSIRDRETTRRPDNRHELPMRGQSRILPWTAECHSCYLSKLIPYPSHLCSFYHATSR